jgi:PAS domain S-box-containing protein
MHDYDHLSREELIRHLLHEHHLLDSVTQATDVMLVLLDPAFNFLWVNRAYAESCRMLPEEMVGKNHFALYPDAENEAIFRQVLDRGEAVFYKDKPFVFPDQPERGVTYWDWSLKPVKDAEGAVTALVFSLRETTRFKQAEEALRRSEERLRLAWQATRDVIWDWDILHDSQRWNVAGTEVFGWSDAVDAPQTAAWWLDRVHPDDRMRVTADFHAVLDDPAGDRWEDEYRFRRADGAYARVLDRGFVLRDARGRPTRMIGAMQDITARKQAEEALQEADRRKNEFLATLGHELRNPLAPLRTGLEILQLADGDPRAQAQARAMMSRQLDQLVRLVEDLLDLSRISSGRIELRREPVALADCLHGAVETSRPLMDARGHTLELDVPAEPLVVEGDALRLTQVFANLLNNAAKYTDPGGRIEVGVARDQQDVLVTITDNGIGIAASLLPRVFDMFIQDHDMVQGQGGLGIGLHLVQRLVAMHGGEVTARSAGRGLGSTFVVRLPLVEAAVTEQPTATAEAASALQAGCQRILIVDDNHDVADSLAMMLTLLGHEVRLAYDGLTALSIAADFRPSVILLDLGMPTLDGIETAARIRAAPWGRETLLVALTGRGQENDRRRTQAAGFDIHLVKPVAPPVLTDLLARLPPCSDLASTPPANPESVDVNRVESQQRQSGRADPDST